MNQFKTGKCHTQTSLSTVNSDPNIGGRGSPGSSPCRQTRTYSYRTRANWASSGKKIFYYITHEHKIDIHMTMPVWILAPIKVKERISVQEDR